MKNIKSYIIVALIVMVQWPAYAQEGFYGVELYRSGKNARKLASLQRTGFQAVDDSLIKLSVDNGKGLMKVLDYAENAVLESKSGNLYPISKKEIHYQLLSKHHQDINEAGFFKKQLYLWSNRKVLAGKANSKWLEKFEIEFQNEWGLDWQQDFKLHFVRKKDTIGYLFFKALEAKHIEKLPTFEFGNCDSFDRWTYFTTLDFSFDKPQRPIPYSPLLMHRLKRDFTIYFPHNDFQYPQEKLEPLEKYLRSTDYDLFETKIFAYSSVEGDSANNLNLMRKRAEVLNQSIALSNLKITKTGVSVAENWDLFNEQIRALDLDTLITKAEWKEYLKNDSISNQLSSELDAQRTAMVELFLQKPMTDEEVLLLLKKDIQGQSNTLLRHHSFTHRKKKIAPPINLNDPVEGMFFRRILGIREFASELYKEGRISREDLCDLDRNLPEAYYLYVFYHLDSFKDACDEKSYVMNAHHLAIDQLNKFPEYKEHYKILCDIQAFIFNQIEQGSYPAEDVLDIAYPDQLAFQIFELSRLDFMEKMITEGKLDAPSPIPQGPDYYYTYFPKTTYYQFLKAKVLTGTTKNPKNTSISRSDWMLEFDQYTFMFYTTTYWKPLKDLKMDSTVTVFQMQEVMKQLLAKPGKLCPYQLQQLNLDFQHKLIQWAALNNSPKLAIEASKEMMQYYDRYGKDRLLKEQAVIIGKQLYTVNKWFNNSLYNWVEELEEKAD